MFKKLFVGSLPFHYSNEELRTLFASKGTVISAEMVFDPDRGRTRGFGFVEMRTPEEAQVAMSLNGVLVGEKKIFVSQAREKPAPRVPRTDVFPKKIHRKAGRDGRELPPLPLVDPFRNPSEGHARRYKGARGRGPANGPRTPFGAPKHSGFSKPNKWEPRSDDKRSFSPPRDRKGDFGPSRPPTHRPPAHRPSKPKFWQKFSKKSPPRAD